MNLFDRIASDTAWLAELSGAGVVCTLKRASGGVSSSFRVVFSDHQSAVTETDGGIVAETTATVCAPRAALLGANANAEPQPGDVVSVAAGPDAGEWRVRAVERDHGAFVLAVAKHAVRVQRGAR